MSNKYRDYFDVDKKYFPCIDDSAISAGAPWENTYPHTTFIDLLDKTERMLSGTTHRSLWIHGAYGTGKSQCAYALKRLLEVTENEFSEYWNSYSVLSNKMDLYNKLLGHKERGIVTVYRYASGDISSPRNLFYAIQESISAAIKESPNVTYYGENTLKESVIEWLNNPAQKDFINALLKQPEWSSKFAQSSVDEVVSALTNDADVKLLMNNIFDLADKIGITAFSLDADKLKSWIKDVVSVNKIKIIFIWDEFSGFFKQNKNSLDEFQKIVALCQEVAFYLVIVTHQTNSIINENDQSWSIVKQRFDFSTIDLPDNIAFDLIGNAFNVKAAAKDNWNILSGDLNGRINTSRVAVMQAAKINNPNVIKDIMPIHPMAALVLKNIAQAFQSNQRSMFDFIKITGAEDIKAFQWFIDNYGPLDEHPLLTIDQLWNFFYEKGKDDLSNDIRTILDAYTQYSDLTQDEQKVLKTVLIMQSLDKRLGGTVELFKPTDQNLSYAFEGISSLETSCKNIAKSLVNKGVLVNTPIGNGKFAYGAAVLAGDQAKIDEQKKKALQIGTNELILNGELESSLNLSPALKLRYEDDAGSGKLITVTVSDFNKKVNSLKDVDSKWHITAVLALAKNDDEATTLREMIKKTIKMPEYQSIVFIDALSSTLGNENFNTYADFIAMSEYYQSIGNTQTARENVMKAKRVLTGTWKNQIYNGQFIVYYSDCVEGERATGGFAVASILQKIVIKKYPNIFDFEKGLSENTLKLTQGKKSAACGITQQTSGVLVNIEKSLLPDVWKLEKYWEDTSKNALSIVKIKKDVDEYISGSFDRDGQISIGDIYDFIENNFGFAPCNLTAFIIGFILKEYSGEPYRYSDLSGSHEPMTCDKMAEMLGNYIGKNPNPTYIVKMTAEERAFYELTEKAWDIESNTCSSVAQVSNAVKRKMQAFGLPVWVLEEVDEYNVYDMIRKYIDLVQFESGEAHKVAIEIGRIYIQRNSISDNMAKLLTQENCQNGMQKYISNYRNGILLELATSIGANSMLLNDISNLFLVEYSNLWNVEIGKKQIDIIIADYLFVKISNYILNSNAHSKLEAFDNWVQKLKFYVCSYNKLCEEYPYLRECFDMLLKIYSNDEILSDQMQIYANIFDLNKDGLKSVINDELKNFKKFYNPYLEDLTDEDIVKIKSNINDIFAKTDSNTIVKNVTDEYRKNQNKTKLFDLWKNKTGTKNPRDWSLINRTSILSVISKNEYDKAKFALDVLNGNFSSENDIERALDYLSTTKTFDGINDKYKIDYAFKLFLGRYRNILVDLDKVRDSLEKLSIDTYEWYSHPKVRDKLKELAEAEYKASGSELAIKKIENLSNEEIKKYLIDQIKNNINLGIEIINGGE